MIEAEGCFLHEAKSFIYCCDLQQKICYLFIDINFYVN